MIGPDGNGEQSDKVVGAVFATEGVTLEAYTGHGLFYLLASMCCSQSCFGADGPSATTILSSRFGSGYGMVVPASRKVYNCSGEICARSFSLDGMNESRRLEILPTPFAGTVQTRAGLPRLP